MPLLAAGDQRRLMDFGCTTKGAKWHLQPVLITFESATVERTLNLSLLWQIEPRSAYSQALHELTHLWCAVHVQATACLVR
jgi:hypothetical protein